ncbi:hypothetical protein WJX79_005459 [Trebouxia sp. C0005]|nr:MAG: hypothetical protein FRX49_13141 [Trebouxia sp. A1-2]
MQFSTGTVCRACSTADRSSRLGYSSTIFGSRFAYTRPTNELQQRSWHSRSTISNKTYIKGKLQLRAAAGLPTNKAPSTAAIPLLLAESYYALQNPAMLNMRYSEAVQNFARTAVTAYECGYSEDTLCQELEQATAQQSTPDSVKAIDQKDCLLCVCMVWMTLVMSKSTRRWSTAKPVSEATLNSWQGFVSLIVKGYMEKRWAWTPIDRLQMELTAVTGRTERPHVVAEWARVVHTTLEQVAPQFPSR